LWFVRTESLWESNGLPSSKDPLANRAFGQRKGLFDVLHGHGLWPFLHEEEWDLEPIESASIETRIGVSKKVRLVFGYLQ
jgi:hypothetical protein